MRPAILLILVLSACKPEVEEKAPPPAIDSAEAERAKAACDDYKKRICARGDAENCKLADSRIESVTLQMRTLAADGLTPTDRAVVLAELRRVAAGCMEDAAKLR